MPLTGPDNPLLCHCFCYYLKWVYDNEMFTIGDTLNCPGGSEVKVSACNAEDLGSAPGLGRSPGEGNGNPLQYSCLENPMDGGACPPYSPRGRKESDTTEQLNFNLT